MAQACRWVAIAMRSPVAPISTSVAVIPQRKQNLRLRPSATVNCIQCSVRVAQLPSHRSGSGDAQRHAQQAGVRLCVPLRSEDVATAEVERVCLHGGERGEVVRLIPGYCRRANVPAHKAASETASACQCAATQGLCQNAATQGRGATPRARVHASRNMTVPMCRHARPWLRR